MATTSSGARAAPSFLHPILAPASIAIIGASADPTKRGYSALAGLLQNGFRGRIYPINPRLEEILGVPVLRSLNDVPGPIDLALICTPAASVAGIIDDCAKKGVRGAVILAAGFRESGAAGQALEQEILRRARAGGVRLIGPNTSGMFNLHYGVNLLALGNVKPGGVGVVSQSGNMLLAFALEAERDGHTGFSSYIGPGNQLDVGFADYLRYLGEDQATRVAVLYAEGFQDGPELLRAAREVSAQKPVVLYKSGSTEQGKRSAASHTGSMAGSFAMAVDLLEQAGISVVRRSDQIMPVAAALADLPLPTGAGGVVIVADGGGQATIAADRLAEAGLPLAQLSAASQDALAQILLPQAALQNPIDVAGSSDADPEVLARCVEICAADPAVAVVLLIGMFGGYHSRFAASLFDGEIRCARALVQCQRASGKAVVVHSIYANRANAVLEQLRDAAIPVMPSIENSVETIRCLLARARWRQLQAGFEPQAPIAALPNMRAVVAQAAAKGQNLLETEARALLRAHGVRLEPEVLVRSPDELAQAFTSLGERPLAMKVVSADILHKSDAGGVRLGLGSLPELHEAYAAIMQSCGAAYPQADIQGVLLVPMAQRGLELIIGVSRDSVFGPVLMVGLGGVFTEIMQDVAFRAVDGLGRAQARAMLQQLRGWPVLCGARARAAFDIEALVDLMLQVAGLMLAYPEIEAADFNPVVLYPEGYALVDARIITRQQQ